MTSLEASTPHVRPVFAREMMRVDEGRALIRLGSRRDPSGIDTVAEAKILASVADADVAGALRVLLSAYGESLRAFVRRRMRDAHAADEAFALVQEDLWRGLSGFRAEASARTWAFVVAQRACVRYRTRSPSRRDVELSEVEASALIADADADASACEREMRHVMVETLCKRLPEEDRFLLELRVERGLAWEDVARALRELRPASRTPDATALRKRFERAKGRLRTLVRAAEERGTWSPHA